MNHEVLKRRHQIINRIYCRMVMTYCAINYETLCQATLLIGIQECTHCCFYVLIRHYIYHNSIVLENAT